MNKTEFVEKLNQDWENNPRWKDVVRPYTAEQVWALKGSLDVEHTFAKHLSDKFWNDLQNNSFVRSLGSMTGGQAVECAKAGLKAIYLSGWMTAGDNNLAGETYPDQSLYPSNSVPALMRRINKALQRADQIEWTETDGNPKTDYLLPTVADAEACFGGQLNAFELMKQMIEAGAACVHIEDQLSSAKRCGHLGSKVLVPTSEFIQKLVSARLAADVLGVPTLIMARTDAKSANYLTSDIDLEDRLFLKMSGNDGLRTPEPRTSEGFHPIVGGIDMAIARGLRYAPYADMLWMEDSSPSLENAKKFADAIHDRYPNKLLALNCSPSFNWKKSLSDEEIASFQENLAKLGYKFFFITLAGWHALNESMFELAWRYKQEGMVAYSQLQQAEMSAEKIGYTATKHQREVGTGYFDKVAETISGGTASTLAMKGSTEEHQF